MQIQKKRELVNFIDDDLSSNYSIEFCSGNLEE